MLEHTRPAPRGTTRDPRPGGSADDTAASAPIGGAAPAVIALRGGHIEGVVLALGALGARIKAEIAKWSKVVQDANIRAD